jgi:hypothetical protein
MAAYLDLQMLYERLLMHNKQSNRSTRNAILETSTPPQNCVEMECTKPNSSDRNSDQNGGLTYRGPHCRHTI